MAVLSTINGYGTHAARPAAGTAGATYFETDTGLLFRDSGSAWQSINLAALVTAKGDLLAGTASGVVARLGVGSDGLPVVADSSQASGLNYGGVVGGTAFAPSGLTGSVAASRYVGATASVAPTTGAHLLGDWVTTQDGKVFICTTAGTPGTWTQAGGSGTFSGEVAGTDFAPTGLTGSTAASRYVGATASGAPASGAHLVGDFVIDQTGKVFICTTAGTPGTWSQPGGGNCVTIVDTLLTGTASSLSFTTISGSYLHLGLKLQLRNDTNNAGDPTVAFLRLNADSGAHYDWVHSIRYAGTTTQTAGAADTSMRLGYICGSGSTTGDATLMEIIFNNYAAATLRKQVRSASTTIYTDGSTIYLLDSGCSFRSTAAITQIDIFPGGGNFIAGTRATLYGYN